MCVPPSRPAQLAQVTKTYEKAAKLFEEELGPCHQSVTNTMMAMAAVFEECGDLGKASQVRGSAETKREKAKKMLGLKPTASATKKGKS